MFESLRRLRNKPNNQVKEEPESTQTVFQSEGKYINSKLFKLAADNVYDYVAITDSRGNVLYSNYAAEKITGFNTGEIQGKTVDIFWKKPLHKELWDEIRDSKKPYIGEITSIRKNGEEYQSQIRVYPVANRNNEIESFVVIEKDINEEKVAEEQITKVLNDLQERSQKLNEEKLKYESLLVNIGDGIIATDQDGNITTINNSAELMLGWINQDLTGKPITEVIKFMDEKDNEIPLYKTPTVLALSTGEKVIIPPADTYYLVRKDKTHFPVGLSVTPYIFGNKIIGTIMVFRDITLEKNIDTAKSEFVSLASHQLRAPLTAVKWYSEMLLTDKNEKLSDKQIELVQIIVKSNNRMTDLINSLLNVSRLELGTFLIEPEPTDMVAVTRDVIDELKVNILEKKLDVVTKFQKDKITLDADPKLLRMVLQNLLSNAVKYTPANGKIGVDISVLTDGYKVEVSDNGYGIPRQNQTSIFNKLYRADNVKSKDVEGTGLGLYIVKQIIDNSGGKIWFKSEENLGSTFYFTLPLSGMPKRDGSKSLS